MDLSDKQKTFQTAEKECQVSLKKANIESEQKSPHTAAQINALKLRAEKTFLQKKQEAMKRWMDKHREESTKTIVRVCNTARAIVERMAEEKNKEMQEMMIEMEKAHQDELRRIRIEARRATIRDFLKYNSKQNEQQRFVRNIEANEPTIKDNETRTTVRESPAKSLQPDELTHKKVM